MTSTRSQTLFRIGWFFTVALSIATYLGVWSGNLVWDDADLVWDPKMPGGGSAVGGGDSFVHCFTRPFLWNYYRPLVSASFFVEHHVFGRNPLGYHIDNTLLHALTTAVLISLLHGALGRRSVALAGALLFAVHPVHISAVGWIGGRTDALTCLWTVLFAAALVRAARAFGAARAGWVAASVGAYVLALFTKEQMLAALPLVPLAFACFAPRERGNRRGAGWVATIPFAVAAVVFYVIAVRLGMPKLPPPRADFGAQMAMAGWTWVHYTRLLLAPCQSMLMTFSLGNYERLGWGCALVGWTIAAWLVWLFAYWMRAHRASAWFLALAVLLIAPVSNVVPMWFLLLGPYRAALSAIGVCALLGRLVEVEVADAAWARPVARGAAALMGVWFLATTLGGLGTWRGEPELFDAIVRSDPDSVLGRYMVARRLLAGPHAEEAVPHVEHMLQWLYRSSAWRSEDDAVRAALNDRELRRRVLQHQGSGGDPRYFLALAFTQLGTGRSQAGDMPGARMAYQVADRLNPGVADTNVGLGYLAYVDGNYPEAEKRFAAALRANPPRPDARDRLIMVYEVEGKLEEARRLRGQ